jgi:tetratricopeptide (TPR) repeat protein
MLFPMQICGRYQLFNMTPIKLVLLFFLTACNFSCKENDETVQDLVDKGVDLVNEKKFEEGIVLYSEAIKQNPKVQLAYYNRGIAYSGIKEYTKAIADFDKIIQLKYDVVRMIDRDFKPTVEGQGQVEPGDVFYQRAVVKSYIDSLQSSFDDFQRAIAYGYSDSSNCLVWQGVLLGRTGEHEKACECFEKAKKAAQTVSQQKKAIDLINKHCGQ